MRAFDKRAQMHFSYEINRKFFFPIFFLIIVVAPALLLPLMAAIKTFSYA